MAANKEADGRFCSLILTQGNTRSLSNTTVYEQYKVLRHKVQESLQFASVVIFAFRLIRNKHFLKLYCLKIAQL